MGTIDLQRQFYEMLLQSQFWSAERMRDYQRSQLAQLLRHAKKNVPFYENRLDAVLKPNGDIDWDRWGDIPIVKRTDLFEHHEAMLAKELPPGHAFAGDVVTSGSSGVPITISVTDLMIHASDAARWRAERWNDIDWSRRFYARAPSPNATWPNGATRGVWGAPWDASAQAGQMFVLDTSARPEEQLEFLGRCLPAYAAAGPNTFHTVAIEAMRTGAKLELDAVFTTGERATEDNQLAFREAFGARTIELYSAREAAHIAYRCAKSGHWHVNAEAVLVEIVDEAGRAQPKGQAGHVVVTPFFSTVQPLVRYDLGDIAALAERCSCGVNLPVLSSLDGRVTQMFSHPDGRRILRHFPEKFREVLGCTAWQFAQTGPHHFEIRYVPTNPMVMGDERTISSAFKDWYFPDANVVFRRVERLALAPAGKFAEYVNEYDDNGGAARRTDQS
jgi:phenylacetate-CoA ligase